jgi:lipopolysaccharide export system permease protein
VGGIALGIGLGLLYWVMTGFFEALGNFALLPPVLAGWGPNMLFAAAGVYLILQVET